MKTQKELREVLTSTMRNYPLNSTLRKKLQQQKNQDLRKYRLKILQEQQLKETVKQSRFDVYCPPSGCGKYLFTVSDDIYHGVSCSCGKFFVQCGAFSHDLWSWVLFNNVPYSEGEELEKLIRDEKIIEIFRSEKEFQEKK